MSKIGYLIVAVILVGLIVTISISRMAEEGRCVAEGEVAVIPTGRLDECKAVSEKYGSDEARSANEVERGKAITE